MACSPPGLASWSRLAAVHTIGPRSNPTRQEPISVLAGLATQAAAGTQKLHADEAAGAAGAVPA
ncbi:hypothetical protein GCM10028796_14420 [Ramlibacter monticola]